MHQLAHHFDGVFDGVALRKLVGLGQDAPLFVLREQHGLGRRRSAVDADEAFHDLARLESGRNEFLGAVFLLEARQVVGILGQAARAAALGLLLFAAHVDVPFELVPADVLADCGVFGLAEFHRTDGREILGIIRRADQIFGRNTGRQLGPALFPDFRDVVLPAIAHALDVAVRTAQQQHYGQQRVAAREHGQVLHHDGFEQRCHQLVRRHAHLLQAVDVGLREHAALAGHGMQLQPFVAHFAKLLGGNAQLGVDLVDDRACAARALIVHGRQLLLPARLRVFLEDDDFGVLAAQFDHRSAFRIQLFHGQRNGIHFLDEFRAQMLRHAVAARAGDEDARLVGLEAVDLGLDALQELQHFFRLLGVVTLVVRPHDLVRGLIHDHRFHGGRTHVHSDEELFIHRIPPG